VSELFPLQGDGRKAARGHSLHFALLVKCDFSTPRFRVLIYVTHIGILNIFEDQNNPADELRRINRIY
jgi:hypothetical protein